MSIHHEIKTIHHIILDRIGAIKLPCGDGMGTKYNYASVNHYVGIVASEANFDKVTVKIIITMGLFAILEYRTINLIIF